MLDRDFHFKNGRDDLVVMIKPAPKATYKNIVRTLDEMVIDGLKRYALMDLDPDEKEMLIQKNLYN